MEITYQIYCVTADNTANNDTTCQHLQDLIRHRNPDELWLSSENRLPCVSPFLSHPIYLYSRMQLPRACGQPCHRGLHVPYHQDRRHRELHFDLGI
jgi:hypothetical protein